MSDTQVTLEGILAAHKAIRPYVRRTPLDPSHSLALGSDTEVHLKLECFQVTGSFKPRGAFARLLALDPEQRRKGVVASTAGNHGIGLAYAAQRLGIPVDVYLPYWADRSKVRALEQYNACLTWFESVEHARESAKDHAQKTGKTFVSAYNDTHMIMGGGTIGIEIHEDLPDIDLLVVSVGGGGMAAGAGIALKALAPNAKIWAVQAAKSPKMAQWIKQGHTGSVPLAKTIAEGLAVDMEEDTITYPILRDLIDRFVLLEENEVSHAVRWLLNEHQLLVEPSGAAAVAALLKERPTGFSRVAAVLTGRNVSGERYSSLISPYATTG
ncbi:threonine/serine dehydratase [Catellatospora citrea]|uniref:threonine ammonia-lyase n=1 Tax=Catellatospora citrea TaxID=53366 RepID=UPI0033E9A204